MFGLGLDWFPVPSVSIGGHAAVRASYLKYSEQPGALSVGTTSSGIRVQLYF